MSYESAESVKPAQFATNATNLLPKLTERSTGLSRGGSARIFFTHSVLGIAFRRSELPVVDQAESTKSQLHLTVGMTCNFSFAPVREIGTISSLKNPPPK